MSVCLCVLSSRLEFSRMEDREEKFREFSTRNMQAENGGEDFRNITVASALCSKSKYMPTTRNQIAQLSWDSCP